VTSEENRCYCSYNSYNSPSMAEKECSEEGLLQLSSCRDGAPIAMSLPHFLYGSEKLVSDIDGLHPDENKHRTYTDIQPVSSHHQIICDFQILTHNWIILF